MPKAARAYSVSTKPTRSDIEYTRSAKPTVSGGRAYLGMSMIGDAIYQMQVDHNVGGFIVRNASGNPIGAVSYTYQERFNQINVNFLGSDQSQKGIGTMLMKRVAKVAAKKNAGLILQAYRGAIGFYEQLGFRDTGDGIFTLSAIRTRVLAKK